MSVVNDGIIFEDDFADTSEVFTEFVNITNAKYGVVVFVAPDGADLDLAFQALSPDGVWHDVDVDTTTDGSTDAIVLGNVGRLRVGMTPSAAPSSAKLWVRSFGG